MGTIPDDVKKSKIIYNNRFRPCCAGVESRLFMSRARVSARLVWNQAFKQTHPLAGATAQYRATSIVNCIIFHGDKVVSFTE